MKKLSWDARTISILAIMTAITTVLTMIVKIPTAPTRGYLNLGDAAVYFAAFAFSPVVGGITGGIGTGLSDALSGYPQWVFFSLIIHGVQGVVAGLIGRKKTVGRMIIACFAGAVIMVGGYWLTEVFLYGPGPALTEAPGNLVQNVAGWIISIPLVYAVRRAYPPIDHIMEKKQWTDRR